jgi:excisionase family DNA binding protein
MNAREAGERIGHTEKTIRAWIASGRLHATRVGHAWHISEEDLRAVADVPSELDTIKEDVASINRKLARIEERLAWLEDLVEHAVHTMDWISGRTAMELVAPLEQYAMEHHVPAEPIVQALQRGEISLAIRTDKAIYVMPSEHPMLAAWHGAHGFTYVPCRFCHP